MVKVIGPAFWMLVVFRRSRMKYGELGEMRYHGNNEDRNRQTHRKFTWYCILVVKDFKKSTVLQNDARYGFHISGIEWAAIM